MKRVANQYTYVCVLHIYITICNYNYAKQWLMRFIGDKLSRVIIVANILKMFLQVAMNHINE